MYLIKNVNLYDPMPKGVCDILTAGGQIAAVGKQLQPALPGVKEIDGSGMTAVPGFIDQHVHVTGGGGEGGFESRTPEVNVSSIIKAGVTTVVGLLGTDSFTRSVENLVAKTKALKREGITAYCLTGAYIYPSPTVTGSVAKDLVYIDEVLGCKMAISDHRASRPTKEELIRLASDIRMAALVSGKPGVLHLHVGSIGRGLEEIIEICEEAEIPIKHFRPTHMDCHPEAAKVFIAKGGWVDFTAEPSQTDVLYQTMKEVGSQRITVSSDAGGSIPVWNETRDAVVDVLVGGMEPLYEIIRNLVIDFGVPMEEAVKLITSNVAKSLELYPRKGCLQAESDADLVLLDQGLHIDTVMAKGRLMMRGKKLMAKGAFEQVPLYKEED